MRRRVSRRAGLGPADRDPVHGDHARDGPVRGEARRRPDEARRGQPQARDRVQHGRGRAQRPDLRAVAAVAGRGRGDDRDAAVPDLHAGSTGAKCPNATALANLIASPDASNATWQTQ